MLNRFAIRIATVRALRGRTLVGQNVRDSEIGPIEDIAADAPMPIITVYTDDGLYRVQGRDLFTVGGDSRVETGWLSLVIEIALTQRMVIADDGTMDVVQPKTDAAMEANIDFIERQVLAALSDTRNLAAWPEMWRRFATDVGDRQSERGTMSRDGVRFAGRKVVLQVRVPKDPPPGEPIGRLWLDFLALCTSESDLAPLVPILTDLLDGAPLTDVERVRAAFNFSRNEATAMLLGEPEENP